MDAGWDVDVGCGRGRALVAGLGGVKFMAVGIGQCKLSTLANVKCFWRAPLLSASNFDSATNA